MELLDTLRSISDLSADRSEKTLSQWLIDIDNGLLLNQFMRDMLAEALQMRASDIHLVHDPVPDSPCWIKYRIDGDLLPIHLLPNDAMGRLTTLLKRDAGLNFGDRTTPKDGRFSFIWQGRSIDVRVAAGPQSQEGEKLTLRLLDRAALKGFDELFRRHADIGDYLARLLSPEIKGGGGLILLSGLPARARRRPCMPACSRSTGAASTSSPSKTRSNTNCATPRNGRCATASRAASSPISSGPRCVTIPTTSSSGRCATARRSKPPCAPPSPPHGHLHHPRRHVRQTFERLRTMMPAERERSSTFTLSQQVRAILNQRLIKTLCQGCAAISSAGEALEMDECITLNLTPDQRIRRHNPSGCDLCNRTGYLGRTLLLDAILITSSPGKRDPVFKALLTNVSEVVECDGVIFHSRKEGLQDLVREGLVDPKSAIGFIEE